MQILRYFCCLGRYKKQWHSLAWFHPPFKFTHGTLVETKLPLFLFWYTWIRMVVPHTLLLMKSRRRLKGSTFKSGRGKSCLGPRIPWWEEEGRPHLQHSLSSLLLLISTGLALSYIYHSSVGQLFKYLGSLSCHPPPPDCLHPPVPLQFILCSVTLKERRGGSRILFVCFFLLSSRTWYFQFWKN